MAFTTPQMGLRVWNLLTDLYDHAQLADNWAKVNYHDHSPGKGVQIPTEGLADNAVTSDKLAEILDPTGAYITYRTLVRGTGVPATTTGSTSLYPPIGTAPNEGRAAFYINPIDHAIAGRTAKMRVAVSLIANAVAPANTTTFGLYPVLTFGGGSGALPTVASLDVVVPNSTVTFVSPSASSGNYNTSVDFNIPNAGFYALGSIINVNNAAGSFVSLDAHLQVRYV